MVALDSGGELVALQQNLEVTSSDVRAMEGKRVRLSWSPDVQFVIKEGIVRMRIRWWNLALVALVASLALPALGASKTGAGLPTSIGKGEGKLTLVAWEGYTDKSWVAPFEKQTGCKVSCEIRRQLG